MSDLVSVKITVARSVFKTIRANLEGIFPDLDAKIKYLPSAQVEVELALPASEKNEAILEDYMLMMSYYLRIFRRAEKMAENLQGGIDFRKSVTYAGMPVA